MPELPEVETVARGLRAELMGRRFEEVTLFRRSLRFPLPELMEERLQECRITGIRRRAKYLLIDLDSGETLLVHLGMSGQLMFADPDAYEQAKHDHVLFVFDDGRMLRYHDPRRFGIMDVAETAELENHALLAHLGPEPLDGLTAEYLADALKRRKGPVKPALMDQKLVVGVGNIYACEALFLAGIHPQTPACDVADQAETLVEAIRRVLLAAIDSGGSTLRDYVRSSGESGYFQHQFQVYGRTDAPCFACQTPVMQMKQAGRSTFYCPVCQPAL
jgi:formamidopyrimidine-DNA glycosylase